MDTQNAHAAVTRLLAYGTVDFEEVGRRLACEHPLTFLELATSREVAIRARMAEAINEYHAGKIAAIKLYRQLTGEGLREAKHWVERNFPHVGQLGTVRGYADLPEFLTREM